MALTFLHCQAKLGELSIYVGCLARQYRNERRAIRRDKWIKIVSVDTVSKELH